MNSVMLIDVPTDIRLPADRLIRREAATARMRSVAVRAAQEVFGTGDGLLGLFVRRHPKANGAWARALDYDLCVGMALLICAGFDPRAAAALIDTDIACVVGRQTSNLETSRMGDFLPAVSGCDALDDPYVVFLRRDFDKLDPGPYS